MNDHRDQARGGRPLPRSFTREQLERELAIVEDRERLNAQPDIQREAPPAPRLGHG